MRKKRVFIMGGDRGGWALDTEARLARDSLSRIDGLEVVESLKSADIVHTVWPEQLLEDPACSPVLRGPRPVVASFSNDPESLFERVPGLYAYASGWHCVGQSSKARRQLEALGLKSVHQVNYAADFSKFPLTTFTEAQRTKVREKFSLPPNAFLISSFQRDSEGADLSRPKIQKGADIFCALLSEAQKRLGKGSFHVLLGGPRRHWIRAELRRREIPFTFVGREVPDDDYPWQSLPLDQIAELLSASNLNLVTSRWEGAPRALLESTSMNLPSLSTAEGIAEDILPPEAIFRSVPEGVAALVNEIKNNSLAALMKPQRERLAKNHSIDFIYKQWADVYSRVEAGSVKPGFGDSAVHHKKLHSWVRKAKLGKEKLSSLLPHKVWQLSQKEEPEGKLFALQVTEKNFSDVRGLAETKADATLFSSYYLWKTAVKAGWRPCNPTVLRRQATLAATQPNGTVLCWAGGGDKDWKLAESLRAQDWKTLPYEKTLLPSANLLLMIGEDSEIAGAALSRNVPVIFEKSDSLRELVGFRGLEFSGAPLPALKQAWDFQESLRSILQGSDEGAAWDRFVKLMRRRQR